MRTPLAAAVTLLLALPASAGAQTVYSSLPLQGYSRGQTQAIVAGARLALKDSGAPLKYVSLDDSTRRAGSWLPERVARNARRGAQDAAAIAYIGAFNSGASAIAIPILNEAGVPMISPANTAVGLTRRGPGANPGEPDKYYPTGIRTYFRLTPNDAVQGGALAAATRDAGCTAIALVTDRDVYGKGVGAWFLTYAQQLGLNVAASKRTRNVQSSYRTLARSLKGADCFVYTGITANGAVRLFRDVGHALPKAKLFGSDGIAESGFSRHVARSVARRTLVSVDTLAPDAYPAAGQAVLARAGKNADPYFLYGYEAMRLITDAYAAGARDKAGVLAYLRTVNGRAGVIGTYGFDANGDTTLKTFGLYGIRGGLFSWAGVVTAP
jgi:branched-chain amino acid transport system substrate-binding protein